MKHSAIQSPASRPRVNIEGSGPPLVYIAGLDGTGELLFKQIPALAESYRVVTFRSRDGGGFTYDDLASDVASIIRNLNESKATILGESFGGTVALWFALEYPQMVDRLIIVNSFPRYRRRFRINLAARLAAALPFRSIRPVRLLASALGLFVDGVSREDRRRFYEAIRTVDGDGYVRRLRLISEFDVIDRLSEIRSPATFIATEKDLLVPSIKEARLMAGKVPGARLKIVNGAGHACLLGSQVRLAQILAE